MTHFFFSRTLRRLCLALLAVFCFSYARADDLALPIEFDANTSRAVTNFARSIVGVNATQATVDDAASSIYDLLESWSVAVSAGSGQMILSLPCASGVGFSLGTELGRGLFSSYSSSSCPETTDGFLYQIQRTLFGQSGSASGSLAIQPTLLRVEQLLKGSASSNDLSAVLVLLRQFAFRADSALRTYNADQHFTGAGDLLVHDPEVETAITALQNEVRVGASSIEDGINESNTQLMTLWQQLQDLNGSIFDWYDDWRNLRDYEAQADEASPEAYHNAVNEGYNAKDDDERDGTQLYEEAELPKVEDNYTPDIGEDQLGGDDLGLQDIDDDVTHSAIVTLVHGSPGGGGSIRASGSGGIVPSIEWDIGRDSALVSFASRMGQYVAWLSSTLFILLLSYKGLHMWRVVRVGFVQAATGNEPTLQLAYNPF